MEQKIHYSLVMSRGPRDGHHMSAKTLDSTYLYMYYDTNLHYMSGVGVIASLALLTSTQNTIRQQGLNMSDLHPNIESFLAHPIVTYFLLLLFWICIGVI